MAPKNEETAGSTMYVLPEISIAVPKEAVSGYSSLTYSYGFPVAPKNRSKWSIFTNFSGMVVGFFVAVVLFAIPVTVTSVVLTQTLASNGYVQVQNQNIPSSKVVDHGPQAPAPVQPAK